jgi:hypothetical protein
MVESLRKLVSGNRRRFTDDDFSLDLTYIIPGRIIAMSYPSHGFERLYRNSIDNVSHPRQSLSSANEREKQKSSPVNRSQRSCDKNMATSTT